MISAVRRDPTRIAVETPQTPPRELDSWLDHSAMTHSREPGSGKGPSVSDERGEMPCLRSSWRLFDPPFDDGLGQFFAHAEAAANHFVPPYAVISAIFLSHNPVPMLHSHHLQFHSLLIVNQATIRTECYFVFVRCGHYGRR